MAIGLKNEEYFCREREDEEAARRLAEELEKEEELKRRKRVVQDEKLAHKLQVYYLYLYDIAVFKNSVVECCDSESW